MDIYKCPRPVNAHVAIELTAKSCNGTSPSRIPNSNSHVLCNDPYDITPKPVNVVLTPVHLVTQGRLRPCRGFVQPAHIDVDQPETIPRPAAMIDTRVTVSVAGTTPGGAWPFGPDRWAAVLIASVPRSRKGSLW